MINLPILDYHQPEEIIYSRGSLFMSNDNTLPVRRQQAYDELLKLQNEFAAEIYAQRYWEKYE